MNTVQYTDHTTYHVHIYMTYMIIRCIQMCGTCIARAMAFHRTEAIKRRQDSIASGQIDEEAPPLLNSPLRVFIYDASEGRSAWKRSRCSPENGLLVR